MNLNDKQTHMKKVMMEIVERIRVENQKNGSERIPTSDDIHKRVLGDIGELPDRLDYYLRVLKDAHYIFSFKIVEADDARKVKALEGYVIAEHGILTTVRENLNRDIESMYEAQFYARKPASTCIKELMSQGRQNNNTPLGKAVNAAVMLHQYDNILVQHAEEYTEAEKIGLLNDFLKVTDVEPKKNEVKSAPAASSVPSTDIEDDELAEYKSPQPSGASPVPTAAMRAADSPAAKDFESMDRSGKWGEAVDKFGVQFLCRIHFRKLEFDKVIDLIKKKRIVSEDDLRFVRNTMRVLEERAADDRELSAHKNRILELKRLSQVRLNDIVLSKKK